MKEILLFFAMTTILIFALFFIVAFVCGILYLLSKLIIFLYNHFIIGTKQECLKRDDLVCYVNSELNSVKNKYIYQIIVYLLVELVLVLGALICVYGQTDIMEYVVETTSKITILPINSVQLQSKLYLPAISYISSVVIVLAVIISTIFIVNRILNIVKCLNNINNAKLKIVSYIKMYNCEDNKHNIVNTNKILIEINRLTQELNADSSRNIWRAIFNSR